MKWINKAEHMREADRYAIEKLQIPGLLLMEAAARSVAERLLQCCRREQSVLILCGMGNNGGDGFAIARMLKRQGLCVQVFLGGNPDDLKGDAKINYAMLEAYQIPVVLSEQIKQIGELLRQSDWIVDAIFGTGLDRQVQGFWARLIAEVNQVHRERKVKILAVDMPSGVQSDTGAVMGCAVEADETITFCRLKPGLLLFPGREHAGRVQVAEIGIPETAPALQKSSAFVLEPSDVKELLPKRVARSHKGTYGRLLMIAGSRSMTGAAILSGRAAYKMGVGLVDAAIPKEAVSVLQVNLPEAVTTPYEKQEMPLTSQASAVLAGPGLGQEEYVRLLLKGLLEQLSRETPLVLDADALNWLAREEELKVLLMRRAAKGNTILTPHMGEAARLLHCCVQDVMEHPQEAADRLQELYQGVIVLKDAVTLVRGAEGEMFYHTTGITGMYTAGSGDVLAGMIAGLCAQGVSAFKAAYTGVYLHGLAGDLAREACGAYGMMASDIVDHIELEKIIANKL